ncbi:MAG: type II toxin-antitoxin system VapC family toxin [Lachnospiraceae bacterium]|nr:type II toxin-antitoxin system VapC family toxin [Lachnospiraceae bacterium]
MKIYMDNCCYNRPYDDQTQIRIYLETEAKLYIQEQIRNGEFELVTSYMLEYENGKNRFSHKKKAIAEFMDTNESYYVGIERQVEARKIAEQIMKSGIKSADALHVACAILAGCDYFITTDDRLLKFYTSEVNIVTPGEFIRRLEADE